MNNVIATIKLAPGRVGFYDELSRVHLTLGAPTAVIYSGTNCARLRRAVRDGVIRLVDGTLGGDIPPFKIVNIDGKLKLASNIEAEMKPVFKEEVTEKAAEPAKAEEKPVEKVEEVKEEPVATEEVKAEEVVAEEAKVEEPAEEVAAEAVEEEKPKKKNTRKSTKKAKE
jgi:hypothetical protein